MSSLKRQRETEAGDWNTDILRSLFTPLTAEDAATCAAAAWIVVGDAETASVLMFPSSSHAILARAVCSSSNEIRVTVDVIPASIAVLFSERRLRAIPDASWFPAGARVMSLPQHRAACFISPAQAELSAAGRVAESVVDQLLARSVSPQLLFPAADRLESLAEFAAGAGHEINNPLGSIIGQTQLLLKSEQETDRRQSLATIGAQAWRIRDMIGDCMLFARPPSPEFADCRLDELVRNAAVTAVQTLDEPESRVQWDISSNAVVTAVDATQFRTLVSHLVRNALEACRDAEIDDPIVVGLQADPDAILLTVTDRGRGIVDETVRRHLFDPCFSGRQAGRGMGFGLPVCWRIAGNHGGLMMQEALSDGQNQFVVAIPHRTR